MVVPVSAAMTVVRDQAFIDNRPTVATAGYNDPLLTGLNLNLEVAVTDSVGGTAAASSGSASFTASNPNYALSTSMSFDIPIPNGAAFGATPPGVTQAQFPNIAGTFTFTVTDANGSVMETSHNLSFLEVLAFPTFSISDNSATPTITINDSNPGPPGGLTRGYVLKILNAGDDGNPIHTFQGQSGNSFTVPGGVLALGNSYDFRGEILDVTTSEIGDPIHDPTQDRSVGWVFNFQVTAIPEPGTLPLLVPGLVLVAGLGLKRSRA